MGTHLSVHVNCLQNIIFDHSPLFFADTDKLDPHDVDDLKSGLVLEIRTRPDRLPFQLHGFGGIWQRESNSSPLFATHKFSNLDKSATCTQVNDFSAADRAASQPKAYLNIERCS